MLLERCGILNMKTSYHKVCLKNVLLNGSIKIKKYNINARMF